MEFSRVQRVEWGVALAAALLAASFILPWSGDERAIESMPVAAVVILLVTVCAAMVPVVVASSETPGVPIVYETFVASAGSLALLLVVIRVIWHPGDGLDLGALLAAAGAALICVWSWKSIARGG